MVLALLAACTRPPTEPLDTAEHDDSAAEATCVSDDLQAAVDAGGTVVICEGRYDVALVVTVDVVIEGEAGRVTLLGDGASPVITVSQTRSFVLRGVSLSGGAGGLALSDVDTVTIEDGSMSSNVGSGLSIADVGALTLAGVDLDGNTDRGLYAEDVGAIALTEVAITGNAGGGVYLGGAVALDAVDTLVSGNTALDGGGLYLDGEGAISGLVLDGNTATASGGGAYLYGGPFTLDGVSVDDNAAAEGGGLYAWVNGLTAVDTTVTENAASGVGGGVALGSDDIDVTGLVIEGNRAATGAGLVADGASVRLVDVRVAGNVATGSGGGLALSSGAVGLEGVVVDGNAGEHGAGLLWDVPDGGGWLVADEDTLLSNNDASGYGGGAIAYYNRIDDSSITIEGLRLEDNTANMGAGLALYVDPDGGGALSMFVQDVVATGNAALWLGGGVLATVYDDVDFLGCTFDGNRASYGGGLFLLPYEDALVRFSDSRLDGNDATRGGGLGIDAFTPVALTVQGLVASGNTADDGAGLALFYEDGAPVDLALVDVTLASNTAEASGGGAWMLLGGTLGLENTWITGNVAADGGGLAVAARGDGPTIEADQATVVTGNEATSYGGGLSIELASEDEVWSGTIDGLRLSLNRAASGAGLWQYGGTLGITGAALTEGVATELGGGVYLDGDGTLTSEASDWGEGATDNAPDDVASSNGTVDARWGADADFTCDPDAGCR